MVKLDKKQLEELRLKIVLGSLMYSDYLWDKYGCIEMDEIVKVDNIEELWLYASELYTEAWID